MAFRPVGKWVAVKTDLGREKKTESGIIYTDDKTKGHYVLAEVVAIGDGITEDVRVGDIVYWELATNQGNHYGDLDLVHQDHIALVVRDDS